MGSANSHHKGHNHHKTISSSVSKSYNEDGVVVLSDEELKHLWDHYDSNKNQLLDDHEVKLLVEDLISHTISDLNEQKSVLTSIAGNADFYPKLMKDLDHDKDGCVTYNDFTKAYHKILENYLASH